uniref:Uncharacterized protein n=1 Tax=Kalanchoe fedtschenkoi TaxID=63787 RepID=A0A7N1A924_KALFE
MIMIVSFVYCWDVCYVGFICAGTPWSEEEHKCFLTGLKKVGKGDWRGISKNFVKSRTPTQVASHAQKYFLRHNTVKHRRRTSLFDITAETVSGQPTEELCEATLRDSASSQIHSPATNSPNAVVQPLVDPSSVLTQHPLLIHPSPPPALQSVPSPNSSSPANYSLNLSLSLSSYSQTSPYRALQTTPGLTTKDSYISVA